MCIRDRISSAFSIWPSSSQQISAAFASGYSYMMEARTTWNTITLPLGYLGFGAASGLSLYLLRCV